MRMSVTNISSKNVQANEKDEKNLVNFVRMTKMWRSTQKHLKCFLRIVSLYTVRFAVPFYQTGLYPSIKRN
jgi:hypothetical protein